MNDLLRLEDQLLAIEVRIGLLEAYRPLGVAREEARIEALLAGSGAPEPGALVPRIEWPARPSLDLELSRLEQISTACGRLDSTDFARVLRARADELGLDAELVRARGSPGLLDLSRRRFRGGMPAERREADVLAGEWLASPVPVAEERELVGLAAELRRLLAARDLELDVLEVDMAARAAVTDRAIYVRAGARVTREQAARIFAHEVFGHALPRRAAAESGPPFRIGPRGADADEEGRALHWELKLGHLDAERRLELALRHLLAAHVLDGGHVGEGLLQLLARGAPPSLLARTAPRVMRGGGLCREIIYLPGLLRVGPWLSDPGVERVFACGRATLDEVEFLARLLPPAQLAQFKSTTTGV